MGKIYGSEELQFEPASVDVHDAVCCEFKDLGDVQTSWGTKHQGQLIFQVEEEDDFGQRKEVRLWFTMTLGTESMPSKIRKFVEKWRGREFTDEEIEDGFDPAVLEEQPCRLDISHKTSKEKKRTYAVIDSIMKPGKKRLKPKNYTPVAERERANGESVDNGSDDDEVPF